MNPAGRYVGIPLASRGLRHGLHRMTVTQRFDEGPEIPDERSKGRSFAATGLPWGEAAVEAASMARVLKGPVELIRQVDLQERVVCVLAGALVNDGGRIVHPDPLSSHVRGGLEKGGVSSDEAGGGKGVLLAYKLVGALMAVAGKIAVDN